MARGWIVDARPVGQAEAPGGHQPGWRESLPLRALSAVGAGLLLGFTWSMLSERLEETLGLATLVPGFLILVIGGYVYGERRQWLAAALFSVTLAGGFFLASLLTGRTAAFPY